MLGAQVDDGRFGQLGGDVALAGPAGAGELGEELAAQTGGILGEVGVDALLPPA